MRMAKALLVVAFAALLTAAAPGQTRRPAQKPAPKPTPRPSPTPWPNKPPSVKLTSSPGRVMGLSGCEEFAPPVPACTPTSEKVALRAQATDPDGDTMLYNYTASAGRVEGDGPEATLDLTGVAPGVYTVTVEVDDGYGGIANDTTKVTVERCICDPPPSPPTPCPTVRVSCPSEPLKPGAPVTFTASVSGGDPNVKPTFDWKVSAGTISRGQGTISITVDTTGLPGCPSMAATVNVGGYERSCVNSASCTTGSDCLIFTCKLDEYGNIKFNDEKVRLDRR